MKFANTRHFHDYKREWFSTLRLPVGEDKLVPDSPSIFLGDLDQSFMGKKGVFFTIANGMYYHRQVINGGPLIGFARIFTPHFGALFIVLDDLQGIASGGYCVTKMMEMQVLPGFEFAEQDFSFHCDVVVKQIPNGEEIQTKIALRDSRNAQIVAQSNAVFIRTEAIINMMRAQIEKNMDELWAEAAPLRIAGEHHLDPKMAFKYTLPRPDLQGEIPSWWEPKELPRANPKPSPFEGRFEIYNVEIGPKLDSVKAVVFPQITAEGPPTLFHGGGGASACIEVLANLVPNIQVEKFVVKFKRPIHVGSKVVVEWTKAGKGVWKAQLLDWKQTVSQEVVLFEKGAANI